MRRRPEASHRSGGLAEADSVIIVEAVREMEAVREASASPVAMMATLGGMHRGHEALLEQSRALGDTLIASLFLNPTQFNDSADLDTYPADTAADLEIFRAHGVDVVFMPSVDEMYPPGGSAPVDPGPLGDVLEGAHRPGHFIGVATVVARLFNVIRPDIAVWGAKDAQQNVIIREVSRRMGMPIDHRIVPTVREDDGLALSSRNARLSSDERAAAPVLYRALSKAHRLFLEGESDAATLRAAVREVVGNEALVALEYVSVASMRDLGEVTRAEAGAMVSLAAVVGNTRLIDNIVLGTGSD